MDEIKLSIIIPHYNTPGLLRLTLDSIPADKNIQILVVDDKSDEPHKSALLKLLEGYPYVTLIENLTDKKGAGVCRNLALERAQGSWLLFADADDYFLKDFYPVLEDYMEGDRDLVYFKPTSVHLGTDIPASRHRAYAALVEEYIKEPCERTEYELKFTFVTPWSKLIKRSLVADNGICFDETSVANDVMFTTKCASYSRAFMADERQIYCVTRAEKTLTTGKDEKKFDIREEVFLNRFNFLKERLDKRQLSYVHLNRIALSHILNALIYGYGLKKALALFNSYRKNRVPLLDGGLFNPVTLYKQASMYLAWRREDKKYQ